MTAREAWGKVGGKNLFLFSDEGRRRLWGHVPEDPPRVLFGHAGDPDSLESATIKAAWLDECGQNSFRLASYEAILGRLSIHQRARAFDEPLHARLDEAGTPGKRPSAIIPPSTSSTSARSTTRFSPKRNT